VPELVAVGEGVAEREGVGAPVGVREAEGVAVTERDAVCEPVGVRDAVSDAEAVLLEL